MSAVREGAARTVRPGARLKVERAAALVCLGLALWIGLRAETFVTTSSVARTGAFPAHGALWIAAAVLGLASLGWAVQAFRRQEELEVEAGPLADALMAFAIMLVGALLITWLGLLVAAGLTYVALVVFYRDRGWVFIGVSTVAYLATVYYGLGVALRVPLPTSPVLPLPF